MPNARLNVHRRNGSVYSYFYVSRDSQWYIRIMNYIQDDYKWIFWHYRTTERKQSLTPKSTVAYLATIPPHFPKKKKRERIYYLIAFRIVQCISNKLSFELTCDMNHLLSEKICFESASHLSETIQHEVEWAKSHYNEAHRVRKVL